MPSPVTTDLPIPKSWEEFEDITADILKVRWATPNVTRNGRGGQRQHGVDIYGRAKHLEQRYAGAQCKRYSDDLSWPILLGAVAEAEEFQPYLAEFLVATTARRDAKLQENIRRLNVERVDAGKFPVEILFWEDICLDLAGDKRLLAKHFPGWGKLTEDDRQPQIDVNWIVGESKSKLLVVEALPDEVRDFASAVAPFEPDELAYLDEHHRDELALAQGYNAEVLEVLQDHALKAAWFQSRAWRRFKVGLKCGIAISLDGVEARDILVTLKFADDVEVYEAGDPPERRSPPALPERPTLKAEQNFGLDAFLWLAENSHRSDAFHFVPRVGKIAGRFAGRSIDASLHGVRLWIKAMAPRRVARFDGPDDGIVVCPCAPVGRSKVHWLADAANLDAPQTGELEIDVRPPADGDFSRWRPRRSRIGPPILVEPVGENWEPKK